MNQTTQLAHETDSYVLEQYDNVKDCLITQDAVRTEMTDAYPNDHDFLIDCRPASAVATDQPSHNVDTVKDREH